MTHDYEIYNLAKDVFKEDIVTRLVELLYQCDDISLLDLIKKLLEKSM